MRNRRHHAESASRPAAPWTGVVLWAAGQTFCSGSVATCPFGWAIVLQAAGILGVAWALRPHRDHLLVNVAWILRTALLFGALSVVARGVLNTLYAQATAANHSAAVFAPAAYALLRLAGAPVVLSDGTIYLQTMRELYPIAVTWEKLAVLPMIYVLLAGLVMSLTIPRRQAFGFLAKTLGILLVAMIVRFALLTLAYHELMLYVPFESEYNFVSVFWHPAALLASLLPLVPVLNTVAILRAPAAVRDAWPAARSSVLTARPLEVRVAVLAAITGILLAVAARFHDPGTMKPGRVLVDDVHSEWEPYHKPYDTEWYGAEAGYNYYCIFDYLSRFYDLSNLSDRGGTLSRTALDANDVLILKIPTRPLEPDEVQAVEDWVTAGGGLYLIGDHTNVFGSGVYLNDIAERLGFRFRYDCVFDIRTVFDQDYRKSLFFRHPVMSHVDEFAFATSCSIEPLTSSYEPIILSGGLKTLPIDYSSSNFYPPVLDSPRMEFGHFVQMLGRRVGRGRVLGFTDSTVFSNFSAFQAGKAELFLGSIDWLMRVRRWWWINTVALFAGLVVAAMTCCLWWISARQGRGARCAAVAVLAMGFTAFSALSFLGWLDTRTHAEPRPRTPIRRVVFERDHSAASVTQKRTAGNRSLEYSIFYQWVQRLGYFPISSRRPQGSEDMRIIIYPTGQWSDRELQHLTEFVSRGGRLLVLDGPSNFRSTARSLLKPFGLDLAIGQLVRSEALVDSEGVLVRRFGGLPSWPVRGGEPFVREASSGVAIGSQASFGRGRVAVLGAGMAFSDALMGGDQGVVPDAELRSLYEFEFRLLRWLVENPGLSF